MTTRSQTLLEPQPSVSAASSQKKRKVWLAGWLNSIKTQKNSSRSIEGRIKARDLREKRGKEKKKAVVNTSTSSSTRR
ncbi:hypothetical protein NC651_007318 [Populus alba x Populus x berolinensis]|nr:hypothetical protein NC651_007318 [Populus alba x Populus x berolinensis]